MACARTPSRGAAGRLGGLASHLATAAARAPLMAPAGRNSREPADDAPPAATAGLSEEQRYLFDTHGCPSSPPPRTFLFLAPSRWLGTFAVVTPGALCSQVRGSTRAAVSRGAREYCPLFECAPPTRPQAQSRATIPAFRAPCAGGRPAAGGSGAQPRSRRAAAARHRELRRAPPQAGWGPQSTHKCCRSFSRL